MITKCTQCKQHFSTELETAIPFDETLLNGDVIIIEKYECPHCHDYTEARVD